LEGRLSAGTKVGKQAENIVNFFLRTALWKN